MKVYNKLVRDKIPKIIESQGRHAEIEILNDTDYLNSLNDKLLEEVDEFVKDQTLEELADILEVIDAILLNRGISIERLMEIKETKKVSRGGFNDKLYLKYVD